MRIFFSLKTEKKINSASLYPKCHFDVELARAHTEPNKPIKILLHAKTKNETLFAIRVMFFFLLLD